MRNEPWISKRWSPGVLSYNQVNCLIDEQLIKNADLIEDKDGDTSALDIRLSDEAYLLTQGTVKPWGSQYLQTLKDLGLVEALDPADGSFLLEPGKSYLFKTRETLVSNVLDSSPIFGQATAKSSVGRMDVLARLIVDGMSSYEEFNPEGLRKGSGELFVEVTPLTFPVRVKADTSITQLRFFVGAPEACEVNGRHICQSILNDSDAAEPYLHLDLTSERVDGDLACAFKAKEKTNESVEPIRLWKPTVGESLDKPRPELYWEREAADEHRRFPIRPNKFYILRSKERIAVPKGVAIYCRAIDETIGEIRIHYAGFVHPWFGQKRADGQAGTPLIFEVRGHSVKANLRDEEILAKLIFYRMSEDACEPESATSYSNQSLQLSTFFAEWGTPESK